MQFNFKFEKQKPIEVVYSFPKLEKSVIKKLSVRIGDDRVVEAKVMESKNAEEKYEDAIAGGHTALKMNVNQNQKDLYSLFLGNIMPGEFATVQIVILQPL